MSFSNTTARIEYLIAGSIAIVSITAAAVVWRSSSAGSAAGDATRRSLITAIQQQAAANEDWRKTYEEAAFAQSYAAYAAEVNSLESSGDATAEAQAASLKQYLLPNLAQLSPLVQDDSYLTADGTYDLQKRFSDLQAENPDLAGLDPEASAKLADSYGAEQRWLTVDVILLAIALFWLALSQMAAGRTRLVTLGFGGLTYLIGLLASGVIELAFLVSRGSL